MNKLERELREQMTETRSALSTALEADDVEKAEALGKDLETMERKLKLASVAGEDNPEIKERKQSVDKEQDKELTREELAKRYNKVFLKAVRGKRLSSEDQDIYNKVYREKLYPTDDQGNSPVEPYFASDGEGTGAILVPEDISRQIQEYKRRLEFDLTTIVSTEQVNAKSGTRPFEKLADVRPWYPVEEWDRIPDVEAPEFEMKSYAIKDYAGILPIPRTMLQDSDQNLMTYIAKYIARKTVVTRNLAILALLDAQYSEKVSIADVSDVKAVLNVTLDPAFAFDAKLITNQDGFNVLDNWKKEDGTDVLENDDTVRSGKLLKGREIVVLPNRTLRTPEGGNAPLFIGNLQEAVTFFDRGVYEIETTTVGGDSFKRNTADTRVIDRFDVRSFDPEAVVAAELVADVTP